MNNKDRFARIQASRMKIQESRMKKIGAIADNDLVEKHLAGKPDTAFIDSTVSAAAYPEFKPEANISREEVEEHLRDLRGQFHAERAEVILNEIRVDVTRSVVTSLGLGSFLAAYDKTGGNVDTVHNVRGGTDVGKIFLVTEEEKKSIEKKKESIIESFKERNKTKKHFVGGIWATEDGEKNYKNLEGCNSSVVRQDAQYIEAGREIKRRQLLEGSVEDIYTGRPLKKLRDKKNLDHIKSVNETHYDPARVLAELDTKDLANIPENLGPTHETINKSKSADKMEDYIDKVPGKIKNLQDKITNQEKKSDLSRGESDKLRKMKAKLDAFRNFDPEKARKADEGARKAQDKLINTTYYTSPKFLKNTVSAGALEARNMGCQQALGLILVEFFAACFDETKRFIASNINWGELIPALKRSLLKIAKRLADKWKNVLSAFVGGSISGFLSSLVTTLINVFRTTAKRFVRLIREGLLSLLRAIKVALFPQEGQSFADSFHAASKLLFSGAVVIGGIALEEFVEKAVLGVFPGLGVLATRLVLVIVAGFTALAVAFGCYILDKLDRFGAVESEQDRFVDESMSVSIAREEVSIAREKERLDYLLGDDLGDSLS